MHKSEDFATVREIATVTVALMIRNCSRREAVTDREFITSIIFIPQCLLFIHSFHELRRDAPSAMVLRLVDRCSVVLCRVFQLDDDLLLVNDFGEVLFWENDFDVVRSRGRSVQRLRRLRNLRIPASLGVPGVPASSSRVGLCPGCCMTVSGDQVSFRVLALILVVKSCSA